MPRLSADVDVTIRLTAETPAEFVEALHTRGFTLRVPEPGFIERTRVIPFVHDATGMPLDIVLAGSGLEDMFLARARPVDIGGTIVPMLDIEDLVIAKVLAGRPKDVDDAAALWHVHRFRMDAARMRDVLAHLEDARGQSDLVPHSTPSPGRASVLRSPGQAPRRRPLM
ncbi:MAG: hypothetical protein R2745_24505 [Vicinamibacterales bacterium]